ncbi:MAG TPA: hypothetical protein VJX66_05510, partial [Amycolatopsis sp.]|nr:hypothetical protein [Amycolatopsis sp.]
HHLYLLDGAGAPKRRFALFGLPKKAVDFSHGDWRYDLGLPNFAVAPGGSWVATSGDLGLAVWNADGTERWAHEWWASDRTPMRLLALDDTALIGYANDTVSGFSAADGSTLWTIKIPDVGWFGGGAVSADHKTAVIWSDSEGGRLFVIRGGALVNTIPAAAEEVSVSADGTRIAVTAGRKLTVHDAAGGLLWTFTGDDFLRRPRISPDGKRVAVGSELGTLTVLSVAGAVLAGCDLGALPVPAWLPGGDLLVATWMGTLVRYDR